MRGRTSHYTPLEGLKPVRGYGPGSGSLTQHFEMPSPNVISKSRPRAGGVGGTRKKGVFGKSIGEKQELRRAGRRGGTKKKNLELEVEDMEVTVKKNNLTQHQSTFDSELLSESTSPEKELDIDEDNKMDVDEDSDATQPLDTQPNDGAEFHFDEDDEVEKNDVYNRNGGIDEDEDDTDVDSGVDDDGNNNVESELKPRRLGLSSVKKNNKSNRRVIKDEESDESEEEDMVDKKQKKKKVKSTTTKKNTNPRRKKTSTKKDDDTSDEETDYEQDGKENSTKRGSNTNDTTSGKRRSERLKSNKPINLDESRFSEEDSERELDTDDEDITYSTRRVKGDKKRGGGKSSKHGKILCLSECCLGIHCFVFTPTHYDYHIPSIIKQASLPTNTWRKTARMMRSPRAATRPVNPQLVAPPSGETNPTSQRVSSFIYSRSQYKYTYLPMTDKLTLFTPLTNLSYSQGIIEKQKEPCRGK